jgi:hypothetical protein
MSNETFDTPLRKIELHLCGPGINYTESMPSEQRLVLTVR